MAASGKRTLKVVVTESLAAGAGRSQAGSIPSDISAEQTWSSGAGTAGTINLVSFNQLTITPGSPSTAVTHDFDAMTSPSGSAADFANLRGIYVEFESGEASTICIIGASGADAFEDVIMGGTTPSIKLPLGGVFCLDNPLGSAGWAVGTNNDDLKFDCGTFSTTNAVVNALYVGNS